MEKRHSQTFSKTDIKSFIRKKINSWTIVAEAGWNNSGRRLWLVRCDCGTETKKRADQIKLSRGCVECGKKRVTKYSYSPLECIHKWTVLHKTGLSGNIYRCRCKCGRESNVAAKDLSSGASKGCRSCHTASRNKTHGFSRTKIYRVWAGIKSRCYNKNNQDYRRYGGRGIKVSQRWLDFKNFLADMGEPAPGMTIDRIDSNGDYCKKNCRWISRSDNAKRMHSEYIHISKLCESCKKKNTSP